MPCFFPRWARSATVWIRTPLLLLKRSALWQRLGERLDDLDKPVAERLVAAGPGSASPVAHESA